MRRDRVQTSRRSDEVIGGRYNNATHLFPEEAITMKQDWIDFLAQQGARHDSLKGFGLDFGHPADELASAQSASILTPLVDQGLIRVSGADAAEFLHNLLTNDVKGLPADGARRYGFCNAKGRLLANFMMWHEGDDLMIALSADLHAAILKKLSMFVLRSKVKLTDAGDERVLLGLSGPQAEAAVAELGSVPAAVLKVCQNDHGQTIRLDEQRYLLSLDAAAAPAAWRKLAAHARPAGLSAWHWLEIAAGMPNITAATQEEFIPQMVNYELIGGVSFSKGCYPGQEIVARTQYLGKIKRRMYRAHLESGVPLAGAHLYAPETGEQSCGRVVNVAPSPQGGNEMLAVIQSTCADAGEVHLDNPAGPRLVFQSLPYDNEVLPLRGSQSA